MGYTFGDLVIESVIREGLEDIRTNANARLPVIYSQLLSTFLSANYGQGEIERFKSYLLNEKIDIVFSYRDISARIPCICIQPIAGQEDVPRSFFGNFSGQVDTYLGGAVIDRKDENSIPLREGLQISVHTTDPGGPTALRWLFASTIYFLASNTKKLTERGVENATFSISDFSRVNDLLPENIYSRYLTVTYMSYFSWTEADSQILLDTIDLHGGPGASEPGALLGGVKVESGKVEEYEDGSLYTIDKT